MNAIVSQAVTAMITWQAQWMGRPGPTLTNWQGRVLPAPLFRREFGLDGAVREARVGICGLGYFELRLNGDKVGDHVLAPTVSQYDRRVRYLTYDVTSRLRQGANAVGIILGNGWYNCHTPDVWHFDKASWRDYPKVVFQLDITYEDGRHTCIASGPDWRVSDGPIRFDGLRNGETYDAREERVGWDLPGFADEGWQRAQVVAGPGGVLEPQAGPPCKVVETIAPVAVTEVRPGVFVFDLGQNIAGWAQLRVEGDAGTEVVLRYAEKVDEHGDIDPSNIDRFIKGGECQTDRYILRGDGEEIWEPRFTYHGFQYVQVSGYPGTPTVADLRGRVVHTACETIGQFSCSSPVVNRLQACTLWAYRGNFVGIPTDCPHREKNGWTGDAQLAAETGLCNVAAAAAYGDWLETLADTQRPSGQLPGIAPSAGWGYNWGSGPAWDCALILIPWYIYLYTGDLAPARTHYEAMKRYVDFCSSMATDDTVSFGLGDWCHVDSTRMAPAALTSTGYYYRCTDLLATFAALMGRDDDVRQYRALAARIRAAFNIRFYKGDGIYAGGEQTALACALYHGLAPADEQERVLEHLVRAVEANGCRADFGILGAAYVPRVLAENGYMNLAYRILTQPDFPGWVNWLDQGATTLWESWDGNASRNHIMFGDVSAWMYHYLAGIKPDPEAPGFSRVVLRPGTVAGLDWVRASHQSPHGLIRSEWQRTDSGITYTVAIPDGIAGEVVVEASSPAAITVDGMPLSEAAGFAGEPYGEHVRITCPPGAHVLAVASEAHGPRPDPTR